MNWTAECAAIIPCLNEAGSIAPLVQQVSQYLPKIFIVDDGSTDQTAQKARQMGAEVIQHPRSLGKGAALQAGLARAAAEGYSWAITLDGDGQHAPSDIPKFFEAAATGADLVLGNRMDKPDGMPGLRIFVNRWMSRRISTLAAQPFPDSQCGFRLLNLRAWSALRFDCRHFDFESEMLLNFARAGRRIAFVPVQAIYNGEHSKIRPLRDSLRWFKWWFRVRLAPVSIEPLPAALPGPLAERAS